VTGDLRLLDVQYSAFRIVLSDFIESIELGSIETGNGKVGFVK